MKTEFDIQLSADDILSYNLYQAYLGSASGVISIIISVLVAVLAVYSGRDGSLVNAIIYGVLALIILLYTPVSLRGRARIAFATNEELSRPLHFEMDEKKIYVTQKGEKAELNWGSVLKVVETGKVILLYNYQNNAYIIPKDQVKAQYNDIRMLAINALPPYRCKMK